MKIQNYSSIKDKPTAESLLSAVATIRQNNSMPPISTEEYAEYLFLQIEPIDYWETARKYQLGNLQIKDSKINLNSIINLINPSYFQTINGALIEKKNFDSLEELEKELPVIQNNLSLTKTKWSNYIKSPYHEIFLDTRLGRADAMEEMRGKHVTLK